MEDLLRVLPVVCQLRDGTWVVSVEFWTDSIAIRWAQKATPRSERYIEHSDDYAPWHPSALGGTWTLTDDLHTEYEEVNNAGSGIDAWFRGEVTFSPSPPESANTLHLTLDDEEVTVPLRD